MGNERGEDSRGSLLTAGAVAEESEDESVSPAGDLGGLIAMGESPMESTTEYGGYSAVGLHTDSPEASETVKPMSSHQLGEEAQQGLLAAMFYQDGLAHTRMQEMA